MAIRVLVHFPASILRQNSPVQSYCEATKQCQWRLPFAEAPALPRRHSRSCLGKVIQGFNWDGTTAAATLHHEPKTPMTSCCYFYPYASEQGKQWQNTPSLKANNIAVVVAALVLVAVAVEAAAMGGGGGGGR